MTNINVQLNTAIAPSFRVSKLRGSFGLSDEQGSSTTITATLPGLNQRVTGAGRLQTVLRDEDDTPPWQIGAIVGPSGSGKSTIAREAFGREGAPSHRIAPYSLVDGFNWPSGRAIVEGFDDALSCDQITAALGSVGLADVPAWLRPYGHLSTGQRFRADLARALMLDQPVVAFDEFTSVVDRQVARFAAAAIAKAVRSGRSRCARFVAVTCHYDVLQWLKPDWHFDTATGRLARGCLQRPAIRLDLARAHQSSWARFAEHHYLSSDLNPAARCYLGLYEQNPVAFCATLANHGVRGQRRIHRLVVLPDFQGMGIGMRMLDAIAAIESETHTVSLRTTHPGVVAALDRNIRWQRTKVSRVRPRSIYAGRPNTGGDVQAGRLAAGFRFRPLAEPTAKQAA